MDTTSRAESSRSVTISLRLSPFGPGVQYQREVLADDLDRRPLIGVLLVAVLRSDDLVFVTLPVARERVVGHDVDRNRHVPMKRRGPTRLPDHTSERLCVHPADLLDPKLPQIPAVDVPQRGPLARRVDEEAPRSLVDARSPRPV
jgi:hypothetical protein